MYVCSASTTFLDDIQCIAECEISTQISLGSVLVTESLKRRLGSPLSVFPSSVSHDVPVFDAAIDPRTFAEHCYLVLNAR